MEHVFQTWRTDEGLGVELARDLVVKGVGKAAREEVVRCRDCRKAMRDGGRVLRSMGIRVEALATVEAIEHGRIMLA